jgi:hypothetical protein
MIVLCTQCRKLQSVPANSSLKDLASKCCGTEMREFVFDAPAERTKATPERSSYLILHNRVTFVKEAGLLPEGGNERRAATHAAQGTDGVMTELAQVLRAEIGKFVLLEMAEDVLVGIQLRGISRKEFQPETPALGAHKLPHGAAAMGGQLVPHDQQLARQVPQQMGEELDNLWTADRSRKQAEVKMPEGDAGHGRKRLPIEVILQHRSSSARRPGAHAMRALA